MARESSKARVLAAILSLSEDSDKPQLEMYLVHTICDRHALLDPNTWRLIDVACSCLQTHTVSIWGFLLLQEAQSGEQGILVVDRVKGPLNGLLFTALGSLLFDQQGKVNTLDVNCFGCQNKESAEALAVLVEQSQTVLQHPVQGDLSLSYGTVQCPRIFIEDEIGAEGWAAIRRAVEHLSAVSGKKTTLDSKRTAMIAGRREDLRAIWDIVPYWVVRSDEGCLGFDRFRKGIDGDGAEREGWAEWEGLEPFIDMTDEEWLEELRAFTDED